MTSREQSGSSPSLQAHSRSAATGIVAVVGSLNIDHQSFVERFPLPGETLRASSSNECLGGKGANQAVAATLMGETVALVGLIGEDETGTTAQAELEKWGVDVSYLRRRPGSRTGRASIVVTSTGENSIVIEAGANDKVDTGYVEDALRDIAGTHGGISVVLCQGELPIEALRASAASASEFDSRFVVNLAPVLPVGPDDIVNADPLVVNALEASEILAHLDGADLPANNPSEAARLARALLGHCRSVVVTLGADGSVYGSDTETIFWQPAAPVTTVIDTTGAGDGYTGALTSVLAAGSSLDVAVRTATAFAALAVQSPGTTSSYPGPEAVARILPDLPAEVRM